MTDRVFLPDIRLIGEIWRYEITNGAAEQVPIWPSRQLAFNLDRVPFSMDGRAIASACVFCIYHQKPFVLCDKGEGDILHISFRTGAFYRLFGLDGERHAGTIIEAGHNSFPEMVSIGHALDAAPATLEARVAVLDQAFLSLLENAHPDGPGEKFRFIAHVTRGTIAVADAAERLGVSTRTLERDCKRRFGIAPKLLLRLFRLAYLDWRDEEEEGPLQFGKLGADLPYCDQAHFLRDFRDLIGASPSEIYRLDGWRRRRPDLVYHKRGDLAASGSEDDPEIADEYEANARWFPYGEETVRELGLEDWDLPDR